MDLKELLGKEIAKRIKNNSVIGVGTGSTAEAAIKEVAKRVKEENLNIEVVSTSFATSTLCLSLGIKVLSDIVPEKIDFAFDGADAVDNEKRIIKGKGGAMLREKILACASKEYLIIVDETKYYEDISCVPVPIEVHPLAINVVKKELENNFDIKDLTLRKAIKKHGEVITDSGNLILDVTFKKIYDSLEKDLNKIPGVFENGIFTGFATKILLAKDTGIVEY